MNQRTKRNLLVFVTPTVIKEGYGTGLETQVSGLSHTGDEFADPNGWRNNAKGAKRLLPTSQRALAADRRAAAILRSWCARPGTVSGCTCHVASAGTADGRSGYANGDF